MPPLSLEFRFQIASQYYGGDTNLHNVLLAYYFSRWFARGRANKGLEVAECNAATPGCVPTKLGGFGAPGNMDEAVATYVLLAEGEGAAKGKTATY